MRGVDWLKKAALTCAALVALLLGVVSLAQAQAGNEGAIEGSVLDQSSAAIPKVHLKATNTATGITFETESDTSGLFRFPLVSVGTYNLSAQHAGFATITQKGIVVTIGARVNLTLTMPLASQTTSVTVTGESPILETTRSEISSTVDARLVSNLPVNNRNFISFVLLTPGVTLDNRLGDISFAGLRGTLNSLVVDASDNNNTFFGQTLGRTGSGRAPYQFSQDAVQEFQVNSNDYSAEFGHAGGAVINVITKSGTNDFHGSGFEFYRDRSLNANDLINKNRGAAKSPYHFNQFGGNIGGPVVRDKAFFFFDYDGQRNSLPNFAFLQLPRNFTPNAAEQAALNYLAPKAIPWLQTQNQDVYLGKVDWRVSSSELLTGRINSQRFTGGNFENSGPQNSMEHTGASLVDTDTFTVALTSTGTRAVNVARFSYVRDHEPGQANSVNPQAAIFQGGQQVFTIGRNFFSPRETTIHRGEWSDTITYVRGRHTWRFGVNFLRDWILNFFPGNFSGQYTFNSLDSFQANLSGTPAPAPGDNFVQAFAGAGTTGATTHPNLFEASEFVQDEWRVSSSLTLNLGLRYDLDKIAQPPTLNPSPALAAAGIRTNFINTDANNFGPRFGFAWKPLPSDRLVVRGGYGIYYGRTPAITVSTAFSNNALNVLTLTYTGANIPRYPNTQCGQPTSSPNCAPPAGGTSSAPIIFDFAKDYVQPYVQQASLGVEWAISPNMALAISYLGVKGTHLTRTRDRNLQGPETPTSIGIFGTSTVLTYNRFTRLRPIPGFFRIQQFESNANSIFHGFTFRLTKRFSHNYQFLASYTVGKVIDDVPDATAVVPFSFDDAKMAEDPLNTRADRAAGVNDQRQRLVLSGIWDLNPYAKGLPQVARGFLGGWELSAILTAQTGQPYSGMVNTDLNNDSNSRTDRTPGLGRDTFSLPNTWALDPRVTRNVRLTERTKLQFIAEAFNIFNHANVIGVNTTQYCVTNPSRTPPVTCGLSSAQLPETPVLVPVGSFAGPNLTAGPRIVQLAVKFVF